MARRWHRVPLSDARKASLAGAVVLRAASDLRCVVDVLALDLGLVAALPLRLLQRVRQAHPPRGGLDGDDLRLAGDDLRVHGDDLGARDVACLLHGIIGEEEAPWW
eukprot:CAMPEP_0118896992 /NCGR_PEP_ID=MMETSP1166-20130328/4588_1 /TAXON_ID=1104430 /ORGANISM="Chrysoreinhardia sp, Strain CCMP3193" /LENGTH=105 /DNA_ID=CAMNT_0006836053 /DNA_START=318 /DNA_END=632 /DNA_ORIENTATION=-